MAAGVWSANSGTGQIASLGPREGRKNDSGRKTMSHLRIGMLILVLLASASALRADQCPDGLPADATCYSGVDANGAFYLIAVPANYNYRLVLWNHGYDFSPPHELS